MRKKQSAKFSTRTDLSLKTLAKSLGIAIISMAAILSIKVSNSLIPSTQPGSGYALEFNGTNQYLDFGKVSSYKINQNLSISLWVNPTSLNGDHVILAEAGSAENGGGNAQYKLFFSGNTLYYFHEYSNATDVLLSFNDYSFSENEWVHMAIVRDVAAKSITLYVNGIQKGYETYNKNPTGGGTSEFQIGASLDESSSYFEGQLDEVRIWNTNLSQQNIRDWMCTKLNDSHTELASLVGYFRFDSGSGSTALDQLALNNGDLINSPLWIWSSAPIGDESLSAYGTLSSLSILSEDGDVFTVNDIGADIEGMQLYIVREDPNVYNTPEGIKNLETSKYWGVKKIGPDNATYSVQLDYENSPYTGKPDSAELVSRSNNSILEWVARGANNDVANKSLTLTGMIGTEYMLAESGGMNLPVEFIGFELKREANGLSLHWQTAWELNNDYFEVERADKTGHFNSIGDISGAGSTEEVQSYRFHDPFPLEGNSYYRIKQVDYDGSFSYSKTLEFSLSEPTGSKLIFPNPYIQSETGGILFSSKESQSVQINLLNASGQLVEQIFSAQVQADQTYKLQINTSLPSAVYFLQVSGDRTRLNEKIILR